jgi:hypothetical protein
MKITWGGVFILLFVLAVILFTIKVFIWEIIGITIIVLLIRLYKRFAGNK